MDSLAADQASHTPENDRDANDRNEASSEANQNPGYLITLRRAGRGYNVRSVLITSDWPTVGVLPASP